jgi:hypothetical protein
MFIVFILHVVVHYQASRDCSAVFRPASTCLLINAQLPGIAL